MNDFVPKMIDGKFLYAYLYYEPSSKGICIAGEQYNSDSFSVAFRQIVELGHSKVFYRCSKVKTDLDIFIQIEAFFIKLELRSFVIPVPIEKT